ncbi:MAG: hypothetical protein RL141_37 [Candidatus Parcubacteria bacterium]
MSGAEVYTHLDRARYVPTLIEIQKGGTCVVRKSELKTGRKQKSFGIPPHGNLGELKKYADIVFIALHGAFGEDGRIQALLEMIGLPFTSSGVLASALAMDKDRTQALLAGNGVRVPKTTMVTREYFAHINLNALPIPCVVKPNAAGSSVGVTIVRTRAQLRAALRKALKEDRRVLVQEYLRGRELTCGVMGNTHQPETFMALPPVEIIADGTFFDYKAKYHSTKTQDLCPAPLTPALTKKIQAIAKKAHILLGCDGLTRSDFILKGNTLVFLETNTIPGITTHSLCPKEAAAMGISLTDFLTKQIDLALKK